MKRFAASAPDLDIFSSHYVLRDASGWQITDAGRTFLTSIEAQVPEPALVESAALLPVATARALIANGIYVRRRERAAA